MELFHRPRHLIFSFDGGGVRMILQYFILKRILDKFPDILERVTIYTGTSAGSILASALATGLVSADNGAETDLFSKETVKDMFSSDGLYRKIKSLGGLTYSKYTNEKLREILTKYLGDMDISLMKRIVFIPSFCINPGPETPPIPPRKIDGDGQHIEPSWIQSRVKRWRPVYYTNLGGGAGHHKKLLAHAVLESSAAPYYFPIVGSCVDGGIGNNNPSLSILTRLMSLGEDPNDIRILSFGSGENPSTFDPKRKDIGITGWLPRILDALFDADQEITSQNCYYILGDNFWRIQPILTEDIPLDDFTKYDRLREIAEEFDLTKTFHWLENNA